MDREGNKFIFKGDIAAFCIKASRFCPHMKKPSLNLSLIDNYWPVSNLPFLDKVIKLVVTSQLQRVLEEADYLDSFPSGFRSSYGVETSFGRLSQPTTGTGWRECILASLSGPLSSFQHH